MYDRQTGAASALPADGYAQSRTTSLARCQPLLLHVAHEMGGERRDALLMTTVGVIGLGYVGLPLAVAFAQEGCDVIAVDVDSRKIDAIAAGSSYIEDVPSELLREVSERIHATSRYARLAKADAILVCVPTPLTRNREPDLGPLIESIRALAEVLQSDQLVVLESTTYPGTTRERVVPLLEE
jgi:UDP-N-acetyl-D-glucosamine dehydrogenase